MNDTFQLNKTNNDEILHVIYDYTSKEDDELTLKRGSVVEVLSKDEKVSGSKGWWTGRLLDSELVGIFPENFVATSEPNLRFIDEKDLQIGNLVGVGGFGHVHYGKFGDVDVAIKTAKSLSSFSSIQTVTKLNDDEKSNAVHKNLIDGLLREARLFSNLKHRNIIQLFGVCPSLSTRNVYLVMEYAHGGSLNYLLQQRKSGLYPNVFIQYAKQIADGMKYLHEDASEHIIHRDLKCSNILILESINDIFNENELLEKTLKITDFGLAKTQLQSSSMSTAGTFPWMSPECIRNNEFSTKSDVWSFGVLLWECLTGEIPYKGFDQMQVAFGIATNKYSLPIPSSCPEEFSQLMKDCWQVLPQDRPTFSQLNEQINQIIELNYSNNELNDIPETDENYLSLQKDWRQEIQNIFEELKTKEQEIRDREKAMIQLTIEQNHQRLELQKWEQKLYEREMHVIECEIKFLMSTNNQERNHQKTPKIQKRSGRFMCSLLHATLNGNGSLSSATAASLISSPSNFRHILSVCRESNTSISSPSNSHLHSNQSNTSRSTPTTPNLGRLRTLTVSGDFLNKTDDEEYFINNDAYETNTNLTLTFPEKPPRSSSTSQTKTSGGTLPHLRFRKPKSSSQTSTMKRKHSKQNQRLGEAIWYLETKSPVNTNTNETPKISSTKSTPTVDLPKQNLVSKSFDESSSSSFSTCSTPNDRSLARGIFDINSVLISVGLGRRIPLNSSQLSSPTSSLSSSLSTTTTNRLVNEKTYKQNSTPPSSTNTTPSPLTKKQHKRTCSSPINNTNESSSIGYRARPNYSPIRPNSLVILPPPSSSRKTRISRSDSQLDAKSLNLRNENIITTNTPEEDENMIDDNNEKFYSAQSSKISTPMIHSLNSSSNISNSQPHLNFSSILDIETDEQKKHKTKVLPPEVDGKRNFISHHVLERDFLP